MQIELDSEIEFKQYQKRLHEEEGERNRFEEPLRPFMNPITKEEFRVVNTFDSKALGYRYDKHPTLRPPQLRTHPIVAAFRGIDITPLRGRSVELHVFVFEKGRMSTHHFHPGKDHRKWRQSPNYGGLGCVFGGKGTDCVNCKQSKPINVFVNIGQRVAQMSLTQHEVELRVWAYDVEEETISPLNKLKCAVKIPEPSIEAPMFHSLSSVRGVRAFSSRILLSLHISQFHVSIAPQEYHQLSVYDVA